MYIANSVGQFFLMNEFLGKQFHELGIDIIQYITTGQSIHSMIESVYFPKVSYLMEWTICGAYNPYSLFVI